ncbi:NAD(P)H-dependent glycerol-3-phosphate dehydrogenase [Geopsychrobacter electrodiphilus]|uniref:NAD(P)H-dependent glycerol-3-phosphate dehydrogenase n=1 Tax=Geopsychrobacter electrodiphilus TaxID=225196 RepID=UPI000374BA55|nr:NAD(P)H-dependent glycerol-3-phosphate dehydrogenase [Geopsychrobacter electrodiphilus]
MNQTRTCKCAVIGAGSWGTTLAQLLADKGHETTLWAYESELVSRMTISHENELYLPGIKLASALKFSSDLGLAVEGADMVLLVCPSQVMRSVLLGLVDYLKPGTLLVSAAKGIENGSLRLMSELISELLPERLRKKTGFLSGPSFAREVALKIPTAVVAAATHIAVAEEIQEIFSTDYFRVYTHDDIIGVELGGAMKNVIALAAGVSDGLGFGFNSRAALITRGLAEMTRLGIALGGAAATFSGLSGMGDLVLTCTGDLSRNRTVGIELGRGKKLSEIMAGMQMVAEGVKTTLSAYQLAQRMGVDTPIIEQMYLILYENKDPRQAVTDLMLRDLRPEAL